MDTFIKSLNTIITNACSKNQTLCYDDARHILELINEYFYTTYNDIGRIAILDTELDYFSEFHKYWEANHEKILSPMIDESKCKDVAAVLDMVRTKYGDKPFYDLYPTNNLSTKDICRIRFFSANQDFRGSRKLGDLFNKFFIDPTIFNTQNINERPENFINNIGIPSLSQNDKRIKYAKTASQLLIDNKIEPYDLFDYFNKDVFEIRNFLTNSQGTGFGNKKADIFIRDMLVLNVWQNPINFDKIDVASDINTIKVALRTGILKTSIPLLSSFLDIFCYQYSLIDNMNALAWRKVWESWKNNYPATFVESPCLIDYFVYRIIGKEFCNDALSIFQCEAISEHQFKWHSSRNRTCQICKNKEAKLIKKVLPCTDDEGSIYISSNKFVRGTDAILKGLKECPFISVCDPKNANFIKYNPPKSISILGQTGWDSARATKKQGGGGLMS